MDGYDTRLSIHTQSDGFDKHGGAFALIFCKVFLFYWHLAFAWSIGVGGVCGGMYDIRE